MDNFTWYNPTKIIFGRKTHQQVGQITAAYAKRVLLVYGGGSVIDTAKAIAIGTANPGKDIWDTFWERKEEVKKALPVGVVLTIAAAGSETASALTRFPRSMSPASRADVICEA